jgi:hypothetical protein
VRCSYELAATPEISSDLSSVFRASLWAVSGTGLSCSPLGSRQGGSTVGEAIVLDRVDVYSVGLLAAMQQDARHIRYWRMASRWYMPYAVRREIRHIMRQIMRGNWRAVRSSFNGYLAEPNPFPERLYRCGSGWTKRRAMASLVRQARFSGIDVVDGKL